MLAHGTYIDDLLIPVLVVLVLALTTIRRSGVPAVRPEEPCPYCGEPSGGEERCPRCGFRSERYAATQAVEGGAREG